MGTEETLHLFNNLFAMHNPLTDNNTLFNFLAAFVLFLSICYYFQMREIANVYFAENEITKTIYEKCKKTWKKTYYPIPLFLPFLNLNGWLQLLFFAIKRQIIRQKLLSGIVKCYTVPKYDREIFTHSDGQTVPLDWLYCKNNNSNNNKPIPIVVYLYGICGDNQGISLCFRFFVSFFLNIANMRNFICVLAF